MDKEGPPIYVWTISYIYLTKFLCKAIPPVLVTGLVLMQCTLLFESALKKALVQICLWKFLNKLKMWLFFCMKIQIMGIGILTRSTKSDIISSRQTVCSVCSPSNFYAFHRFAAEAAAALTCSQQGDWFFSLHYTQDQALQEDKTKNVCCLLKWWGEQFRGRWELYCMGLNTGVGDTSLDSPLFERGIIELSPARLFFISCLLLRGMICSLRLAVIIFLYWVFTGCSFPKATWCIIFLLPEAELTEEETPRKTTPISRSSVSRAQRWWCSFSDTIGS